MKVLRSLGAAVVVSLLFISRVGAEESLPVVEVSAHAESETFKDIIVSPMVPDVLAALEDRFVENARDKFPCMDWVAASSHPRNPKARLVITLTRAKYGAIGSFTIDVALGSSIAGTPLKPLEGMTFTLIKPIDFKEEGFSGSKKVTSRLSERIDESFSKIGYLNDLFIRYVPITSVLYANRQRDIIVPVNVGKIRLVNDSPLLIEIRGEPFCDSSQKQDCDVQMLSQGRSYQRGYEDLLVCRLVKGCCPLTPTVIHNLEVMKGKSVYLAAKHEHCSSLQPDCSKGDVARSMGSKIRTN